jgi:hypothetical protein
MSVSSWTIEKLVKNYRITNSEGATYRSGILGRVTDKFHDSPDFLEDVRHIVDPGFTLTIENFPSAPDDLSWCAVEPDTNVCTFASSPLEAVSKLVTELENYL